MLLILINNLWSSYNEIDKFFWILNTNSDRNFQCMLFCSKILISSFSFEKKTSNIFFSINWKNSVFPLFLIYEAYLVHTVHVLIAKSCNKFALKNFQFRKFRKKISGKELVTIQNRQKPHWKIVFFLHFLWSIFVSHCVCKFVLHICGEQNPQHLAFSTVWKKYTS